MPLERGFVAWVRAYRLKSLREHRDVFLTRAPVRGLWTGGLKLEELAGLGGPDDPPGLVRLKLDGAINAALFAAAILANKHPDVKAALLKYRREQTEKVVAIGDPRQS